MVFIWCISAAWASGIRALACSFFAEGIVRHSLTEFGHALGQTDDIITNFTSYFVVSSQFYFFNYFEPRFSYIT